MWYIELAATGTDRPVRSAVLVEREWAWMSVGKGVRWCTDRPLQAAENPVLTDRERLQWAH